MSDIGILAIVTILLVVNSYVSAGGLRKLVERVTVLEADIAQIKGDLK